MSEIVFSLPLIIIFILSPFLSSLRIIQFFIAFVAVAQPYLAGSIMLLLTPVIYYKSFINKVFFLNSNLKKILWFNFLWVLYSVFTIFWLPDFGRFFSEIIQLILILSLSFVFIYEIKEKKNLIETNNYLVLCGLLVTLKSFVDSFNDDFVPINYYAFISVVTCIVIPVSFINKKLTSIFYSFFLLLVAFVGININESRGSTLLGILVILMRLFILNDMALKLRKYLIFFFLLITPIGAIYYYNMNEDNLLRSVLDVERNYSNLERLALLNQSVDVFVNNLKGLGYGATNSIFMSTASYTDTSYPHPHNTLAHFAVELGIIGIGLFLFLFYFSLVSIAKSFSFKYSSKEFNQIHKVAILLCIVLFLFSFLDDMLFNGMFSFYCLLFFAYSHSITNLSQQKTLN